MNKVHRQSTAELEWYQNLAPSSRLKLAPALDAWIGSIQLAAQDSALRLGFPHQKQEAWRYSNVRRILENYPPAQDETKTSIATAHLAQLVTQSRIPDLDSYRLIFAQNKFYPELSSSASLPAGVEVLGFSQALNLFPEVMKQYLGKLANFTDDAFTALNTAAMCDGLFIRVAENITLDKPLEIVFFSSTHAENSVPRLLFLLSNNAHATVIERFVTATPDHDFHNYVEEIHLGENSQLTHFRLVEEGDATFHVSNIYIRQSAGSQLDSYSQDLSGAWMRSNFKIDLEGSDSSCSLQGLLVLADKQHGNLHSTIRHRVPSCRSTQNFKSILLGTSHAVFDAKIVVEKDAQATDAYLKNDNLLLSTNAEVDSKPQLEIYADSVKCGHGTTVGQIDPEQLYYLKSRGIQEGEAKRMLCDGFAAAVVESCRIEPLRQYLETALSRTLTHGFNDIRSV